LSTEISIRDLHFSYPVLSPSASLEMNSAEGPVLSRKIRTPELVRGGTHCDGESISAPSVPSRLSVLKGIDLEVERGEFVSIMGPTGVGKTTLCLALNGIVPQSTGGTIRGEVVVAGLNTRQHPVPELASQVGIVFQDPESQFFNMTVEDEVAFGPESLGLDPREIRERVDWALAVVGMNPHRHRSPFQLSGGEKQRVAIAAILAMTPRILVLDEPTSGLDPLGKAQVFRVVRELKQRDGMTIVMVEQESEKIAEFSDRVVVLRDGKVALVDTPDRVFSQVELMHEIGLAVPQVSELAHLFNTRRNASYAFVSLEDAYRALTGSDLLHNCSGGVYQTTHSRVRWPMAAEPLGTQSSKPETQNLVIAVQDLWYRYDGEMTALRGVDLEIEDGDYVAVIGQNGSGKTTLVKHFNGLLKPTQGRVLVKQETRDTRRETLKDTADLTVGQLAQTVGYVFQNPDHQIFCDTTREELAFGPRNLGLPEAEVRRRVGEALVRFGLEEYADWPPAVLGYGLRRKIGVAAVYTMRPRIFILDEPTTGLDWQGTMELMELIGEMHRQGHTIILVTHDMKLVAGFSQKCLVLRDGWVLAYDDTRAVFKRSEVLRETQIEPSQITLLAKRMVPYGMPDDVLSVDEFYAAYCRPDS
jgi:energy-coupling factor transporter ATP-binding protein EcfA2